jgi:hypothetical protein
LRDEPRGCLRRASKDVDFRQSGGLTRPESSSHRRLKKSISGLAQQPSIGHFPLFEASLSSIVRLLGEEKKLLCRLIVRFCDLNPSARGPIAVFYIFFLLKVKQLLADFFPPFFPIARAISIKGARGRTKARDCKENEKSDSTWNTRRAAVFGAN